MNLFNAALLILAITLNYKLFFSHNSLVEYIKNRNANVELQEKIDIARKNNEALKHTIQSLRNNTESVEELAREELNFVKPNETFYLILPEQDLPKVETKNGQGENTHTDPVSTVASEHEQINQSGINSTKLNH